MFNLKHSLEDNKCEVESVAQVCTALTPCGLSLLSISEISRELRIRGCSRVPGLWWQEYLICYRYWFLYFQESKNETEERKRQDVSVSVQMDLNSDEWYVVKTKFLASLQCELQFDTYAGLIIPKFHI